MVHCSFSFFILIAVAVLNYPMLNYRNFFGSTVSAVEVVLLLLIFILAVQVFIDNFENVHF